MPAELEGKHVVVTGGAGALGRAVVEAFLAAGAVCHVPVRGDAAGALPAAERLHVVGGVDLTDEAHVTRFYADLPAPWASVHTAGGYAQAPFVATTAALLRAQLEQNLLTTFLCCREAVRRMDGAGGRLVNVASRAAVHPVRGAFVYTVSKAAVVALTQALADEVKSAGILVNVVLPSIIDTPRNRQDMPGTPEQMARWPKPAELAATILWLASPSNHLTSGASIPVYGTT
jgi:NAD(P)-dependent dehydrogenase (short-subunit alcohol dehydrogenase family)